jgi:LemA protein
MLIPLYILLGLIILGGLWFIAVYNGLIKFRNRVEEAWSDIEVQLKRRYDLIPNLVNTVKGYAGHEKGVFKEVTEARSQAMQAETPAEHAETENMLTGAIKSLFAVSENYPDLKASENFLHLQRELVDAEDKIQSSRRFYNGQVNTYNTKLQSFPTNMVAGMLGFMAREFFDAPEEVNEVPNVQF